MRKLLAILAFLIFGTSAWAQVTCYAIAPTSSGLASGTNWANAHAGPPTLVRGTRYYFADGSYSGFSVSTAASGTTTIEFRKAQSYDFGRSSDGCSNDISFGFNASTMGAGQGVFSRPISFGAPYFVFNGNGTLTAAGCGGAPTSVINGSLPTPTDCGFAIDDTTCVSNCLHPVTYSSGPLTVEYVEFKGNSTPSANEDNFVQGSGANPSTWFHVYAHDTGAVYLQYGCNQRTVDHSYFWGTERQGPTADGTHGQYSYCGLGENNAGSVESNNVFRDITGTAVMTFGGNNSGGKSHDNWIWYNNVFMNSSTFTGVTLSFGWLSDGLIACINDELCTNFKFNQNTIINTGNSSHIELSGNQGASSTVISEQNNLFYGIQFGGTGNTGAGTYTNVNNNSYLNSPCGDSNAGHVCVSSGAPNPFVNWTAYNSAGFNLASDNADWNNRASLSAPFTTDFNGVTFTTDRGAYQFGGAPPTVATPTFSPVAGTYNGTQLVTITSATAGATICGTVNGTTPAASTPGTCSVGFTWVNGVTISVPASETIKALGTLSGSTNSSVASAAYVINPTVTIIISGLGVETSSPVGIACPPTCTGNFPPGTNLTLASSGGLFNTWTGACQTQGANCSLTLSTSVSSTAKFGCGAPAYPCSSQSTANPATIFSPVSSTNPSGLVNTSNSTISTCVPGGSQACVQWSNGTQFSTGWPVQNILINGTSYSVVSWISTTLAKINQGAGATPGTLTNATYATPSICLGTGCQNATFHGPLNPASLDCATIITDGGVFNNAISLDGTPSGGDNDVMTSINETYFGAHNVGGGTGILHMSMVNNCWQVVNTGHVGIAITDKFGGFSKVVDTRFYYIKNLTQLWQGDITSDSTYTPTELYDVTGATGGHAQCPGIDWTTFGTPTSGSIVSIRQDDGRFSWIVAPGDQGTGDWLFVWDRTLGCSSVNFNTGNVYAFTTSGSAATPPLGQFSTTGGTCWGSQGSTGAGIHDSQMTGDGNYVWASFNGMVGAWQSGTCGGSTITSQLSLWQIGTLGDVWLYNALSQAAGTGAEFDNHPSAGVSNLIGEYTSNLDGFNIRSESAVSTFTQFFPTPANIQDQHCSWAHPLGDDSYPWVCASDSQLTGNNSGCAAPAQCPLVGQNVVFSLNPNLPPTQNRVFFIPTYSCNPVSAIYAKCLGGAFDANFGPANAIGYVTAQGNGFCWATTMFQTLALDNTNAPRSDMVCVALDIGNLARPAPVNQVIISKSEPNSKETAHDN